MESRNPVPGMIIEGRIPLSEPETTALEKLQAEHPDGTVSTTRRDPGNTGPLLVHVDDESWEIDEDGHRKKLT